MTAETALVRLTLADITDELIGVQLLVTGPGRDGTPVSVCGGVSDVARLVDGAVDVWLGGTRVRLHPGAVVVAAPPEEMP